MDSVSLMLHLCRPSRGWPYACKYLPHPYILWQALLVAVEHRYYGKSNPGKVRGVPVLRYRLPVRQSVYLAACLCRVVLCRLINSNLCSYIYIFYVYLYFYMFISLM